MYIWEQREWPNFTWNDKKLSRLLAQVSREQGRLLGRMEALGIDLRTEAHLRTLTQDVVQSSDPSASSTTMARRPTRAMTSR